MEVILKFLKTLSRNNNREWFEKNKSKYLEAKEVFEAFVARQLEELVMIDESLVGLEPKKLIFRIYRDVRFSKNKLPYKTNFGAAFSAQGKGMGTPGYYLHIEPGGRSFAAGGLYMPDSDMLAKIRQEIDYNGDHLAKICKAKKFKTLFGEFWQEEKLKRPPKGYTEDHPYLEWLKLKSFVVAAEIPDQKVVDSKLLRSTTEIYKVIKPLNDFFAEAMS